MRDLADLLTDDGLQRRVRQSMKHSEPFRSPDRLTDHLLRKLEELDRVVAEREKAARAN